MKKLLITSVFTSLLTLTACNGGGGANQKLLNTQTKSDFYDGEIKMGGSLYHIVQPSGQCNYLLAPTLSEVYKYNAANYSWNLITRSLNTLMITWEVTFKPTDGDEQVIKKGNTTLEMQGAGPNSPFSFYYQFPQNGTVSLRFLDSTGQYLDSAGDSSWTNYFIQCFDSSKSPVNIIKSSDITIVGKGSSEDGYLDIQLNNHPDVKIVSVKDPYGYGRVLNSGGRINDYHYEIPYAYHGIATYTDTIQLGLVSYGIKQTLEYQVTVSDAPIVGPIVQSISDMKWYAPSLE